MGRIVSNGRSVRVAVPESTTIVQDNIYLLEGFLGVADYSIITGADGAVTSYKGQTVTGLAGMAGVAAELVLNIGTAEYETSQIDAADTFAKGDKVYYDATNHRLTTVGTDGMFCGVVTSAKDSGGIIWFVFIPYLDEASGAVTASAAELNILDGMVRGTVIVGGVGNTTGVISAKDAGKILVGDGNDVKSVAVSGDATLAANGDLTLALPKMKVVSKVCAIADFTDGTDATGYIDFTADALPKGAIPIGWKAVVTEGFAGDTTAVIQVGISGDVDRFSADTTQSVLAAGTVGSVAIAADALKGIGAVATPRVTVTGGDDFTSIVTADNGAMTVTIYYIATEVAA